MSTSAQGRLLNHLPAIYHVEKNNKDLHTLLSAIEAVLFGPDDAALGKEIEAIPSLLDPLEADEEFLPWLAQWVALGYRSGMSEAQQRKLIAGIVPQYPKRGTRDYLKWFLGFFTPSKASIKINEDVHQGLVVGCAQVGVDTVLVRETPFVFAVTIRAPESDLAAEEREDQKQVWVHLARHVIDLAKPAHTRYQLDWEYEGG